MEQQEITSFNILFQEITTDNFIKIFPTAQKCLAISKNEDEILRAVEISLKFGVQLFSIDKLEHEIFKNSCIAAKNIFLQKIKVLENEICNLNKPLTDKTEIYLQLLKSCIDIIFYCCEVFKYLSNFKKIRILQVKSLFLNLLEMLQISFNHCNISEKIYDSSIHSFSDHLTCFFKKCCVLLEQMIDFLIENVTCTFNEEVEAEEIKLFCQVFNFLSKSSISLMSLDVKIMARIWKTLIFFLEKHFLILKEELDVGKLINSLCAIIFSNINHVGIDIQDAEEINRAFKLSCFNLKLIIKLCNISEGSLTNCQNSLLNLLLMLCRIGLFHSDDININKHNQQNLIEQLVIGIDPLLSYLINDEKIIEECLIITTHLRESETRAIEFSVLCCLILKKLLCCNFGPRYLWFNKSANILQWLFECIAQSQNDFITYKNLPKAFDPKKQEKGTDLYEFLLATASAFIMTTTSSEFILVEKTLIKNILQQNPFSALFAIDIWCLLSRFADSKLCETQVYKLYKIFQQFNDSTLRVEKWYLLVLIGRLYNLLTKKQKDVILKSFQASVFINKWKNKIFNEESKLNLFSLNDFNNIFFIHLESLFHDELYSSNSSMGKSCLSGDKNSSQLFDNQIFKIWKFNCNILSSNSERETFLRIVSLLTAYYIPQISSEHLVLILSKIKKLLLIKQSTNVLLYFTWILKSLTAKKLPFDGIQGNIIEATADIFNALLSFENCFVKLKALEIFFCFSHFTTHTEIIALTVRNSPFLKMQITTFFQKKFSDEIQIDLKKYLHFLFNSKFCHICLRSVQFKRKKIGNLNTERFSGCASSCTDAEELINSLKCDQQKILKNINQLSYLHKKEIENICTSIIRLLAKETLTEYN